MRVRRLLASLSAVAVLAAVAPGAALAAPTPRHTGIGIRLLDAPANLVNDPRAHSYIIDTLKPGAAITRHVEVSNDTGHRTHLLLYADAAAIQSGQFTPAGGQGTNELTSWMTVTPSSVDLPQGGKTIATVTIHVPANAANGERYGAVIADQPPAATGPR